MSDDAPKQPEPVKPEAQTPTPQGAIAGVSPAAQELKGTRSRQQSRDRSQPFLKAASIKTLRGTIGLLEGLVEKLEAEPVKPRRDIAGKISTPTGELPPVVVAPPQTLASAGVPPADVATDEVTDAADFELEDVTDIPVTETPSPSVTTVETRKPSVATRTPSTQPLSRSVGLPFQGWWKAARQKIRSLLPEWVNQKLPDWGLTTAIAALVLLLFGAPFALRQEKPEPVAEIPPAIETPPELVAPESPEPVNIAPPPAPVLTPEQNLIAGIENQVAQISSQYADGLIQSIQANFVGSRLIVKVNDSWYDLSESQQDKLANEMLSRSQELDFSKLEIRDSKDTAIARSPVVGSNMVILKRRIVAANS